jgi:plastocyanin
MSRNRLRWLPVVALAVGLAGCGGGNKDQEQAARPDAVPAAETPAASAASPTLALPKAPSTGPEGTVEVADGGGAQGTVTYNGPDDDGPVMMSDPACTAAHSEPVDTGHIAVKNGKLANVFVYVKSGLEGKTFPAPADDKLLDQDGCLYYPRVQGIRVGQKLVIRNRDATFHNVHAMPASNPEFNEGQSAQAPAFTKTFDKPEVMVQIKCDIHPWMSSWIGVLPHPYYAVTGEDGTFSLDKLTPGTYTLEAWHETLGTATQQVKIETGKTAQVAFDFKPKG